ncbi:FtsK/SpoIIIE domain-containing protein [Ligilactobacillus equi]|uniref:Cell division protein ftsk spoiiie n=1 Tax=Ligilactobacillus equi DSM 15833 = JCM 10991 TaxID=1423740 RepID=A0A0R1TQW7_9LACO|nr:FtsK/SpoIIIE domain-containing protein [Ligilactobacillus equi]KRL80645.1 cell division protein ftsk spoiiie [Ligilactobacillus equi DSM 15833 = JCM 10991]
MIFETTYKKYMKDKLKFTGKMLEETLENSLECKVKLVDSSFNYNLLHFNFKVKGVPNKITSSMINKLIDVCSYPTSANVRKTSVYAYSDVYDYSIEIDAFCDTDLAPSLDVRHVDKLKFVPHKSYGHSINVPIGIDALDQPIILEMGDFTPNILITGLVGIGKTTFVLNILRNLALTTTPDDLKFVLIDGKGHAFEIWKDSPFMYTPPVNDCLERATILIKKIENEVRTRIHLFKEANVSNFKEYYEETGVKLPELLVVIDEFPAITNSFKYTNLDESYNPIDSLEYILKISRSTGIRLILASQSARSEVIDSKIKANITGFICLGVIEPIENELALPETNIQTHQISNNIERSNACFFIEDSVNNVKLGLFPYISDKNINEVVQSTIRKYGIAKYNTGNVDFSVNANIKQLNINKWGSNDLGIQLPEKVIELMGWKDGSQISLNVADGKVEIVNNQIESQKGEVFNEINTSQERIPEEK